MTDAEQIAADVKVRALIAAVEDLETSTDEERDALRADSKFIRDAAARLVRLVARL